MTDLERLWDDYPTGRPPVREILAEAGGGAASPKRRRLVVRPLVTAAAVTGLAASFVVGTLVGSDGGGSRTPPGAQPLPSNVAFQGDLEAAESCEELLASYVDRAIGLVGPWGWGGPLYGQGYAGDDLLGGAPVPLDEPNRRGGMADSAPGPRDGTESASGPQTDRQVNSETGTNVQEAAVDEPDTVKTNGEILTLVRDDELVTYSVSGSSTEKLSSIDLPGIEDAEIMLSKDTVVAIGADDTDPDRAADPDGYHRRYGRQPPVGTRVLTVSLADPSEPAVVDDIAYDAGLLSARQHGSAVRLVLSSGLPDLDFVEPRGRRSEKDALKHNLQVVEGSTIEDWLPTVTVSGESGDKGQQLLDCTNVAIPDDDLGLDTVSVVGFEAGAPDRLDAIGLAGATDIAYESADHLYLVASGDAPQCIDWCEGDGSLVGRIGGDGGSSYLFDFALDGTSARHVASGEVEGRIRDRWSVDEADGVLRVAVGPTSETGNFNSIVTFRRAGEDLVERGRLDGLGRNEDIQSVRWFDDLAIMVTFRRVDPLYAVDLTSTAKPRLLGKLKIPGFSSYLHPLGSRRMVGVGEGPDGTGGWGAQVGLFNVVDLGRVRRMDVVSYGNGTEALAGSDPRSFTWLPEHRTMLTVVQRWTDRRIGYVSVLRLVDGELRNRMVRVEFGDDVDHVRAVPMPDGRVVLVTGEHAQFFEL
ncbi:MULTISPECIES: beta-propeller domain-containing protein [Nocardioides]|uniref:Beta-propeller domain-containing protein n=1 Tax=Nocardioides vastitatis TaxID=2568655 RepID=A0ABW0ZM04_9ACTN|nr:beta-propeller domain-containing protein [Nocardioides sp.]THI96054.1 hypothetical protein E7Z54_17725 [Nocardioides sp.]